MKIYFVESKKKLNEYVHPIERTITMIINRCTDMFNNRSFKKLSDHVINTRKFGDVSEDKFWDDIPPSARSQMKNFNSSKHPLYPVFQFEVPIDIFCSVYNVDPEEVESLNYFGDFRNGLPELSNSMFADRFDTYFKSGISFVAKVRYNSILFTIVIADLGRAMRAYIGREW